MAIYAVAITPLIRRVTQKNAKHVWFADDAAGGGKLLGLKAWWDGLNKHGPKLKYGYFANSSKTWLVVKGDHHTEAKKSFRIRVSISLKKASITWERRWEMVSL